MHEPENRPSNIHASFRARSSLFHNTTMSSFASQSCGATVPPGSQLRRFPNQRVADVSDCGSRPFRVWDPSAVGAWPRCSLLLSCQVSSHYSPRRRRGGFRAPLSSLAPDRRGDEAELTRGERNLVRRLLRRWGRGRRYRAESGGQVTVDETSARPCRPSRPHPAPPEALLG